MRSVSLLSSLIGVLLRCALAKTMAKRCAFVEHEAFAAPAAFGFRDLFEIIQDTALEMIDLGETLREQIARGLFAANAAGAEHGDFPILRRIEMTRGKLLELPKTRNLG